MKESATTRMAMRTKGTGSGRVVKREIRMKEMSTKKQSFPLRSSQPIKPANPTLPHNISGRWTKIVQRGNWLHYRPVVGLLAFQPTTGRPRVTAKAGTKSTPDAMARGHVI